MPSRETLGRRLCSGQTRPAETAECVRADVQFPLSSAAVHTGLHFQCSAGFSHEARITREEHPAHLLSLSRLTRPPSGPQQQRHQGVADDVVRDQ